MPQKAAISTSNFPRPKKVSIMVGGQTHDTVDFDSMERTTWLIQNDLQSLSSAIQQPQTELSIRVITTYYMDGATEIVYADATNGPFTVYLPPASKVSGQTFRVKRMNAGGNNVTVAGIGGAKIDGAATQTIIAQYKAYVFISDGTNYAVF